ncbi:hypothetical protein N7504_000780 [Penicillium tannophilum]|nr:hypothetical protein N7504_000780 [Penicillium tannophilum]
MGRQAFPAFPARRDNAAKERRPLQRQKNGYLPGVFKEQDEVRNKGRADFCLALQLTQRMDIKITNHLKATPLQVMKW